MAKHFTDALNIPEHKVHTILGGVDTERFQFTQTGRDAVRSEFNYTENNFVVGMLGRFDLVKGQQELIEAVAQLYHQGMKHIRLMLAGFDSATTQQEVEGWIQHSGIQDITVITGKRPDVTACLSAMDLGVVASKWSETIARAALELMACKRPLISTDVGVMPDLMPPEAMFQKESPHALAQAIAKTATDAAHRNGLYTAQQSTIAALSGNNFLEQTLALYRALQ